MKIVTDPIDLAESALESNSVVTTNESGRIVGCESVPPADPASRFDRYGPIVGVRCPPDTTAVAYPLEATVRSPGGILDTRIAVVVPRKGHPVIADAAGHRLCPQTMAAPLIDLGRRAMDLPTAEPDRPLLGLLDRIWLDRMLAAVLDADLGLSPAWRTLASLHPALPHLGDPGRLSTARAQFSTTWAALRQRIVVSQLRWPGMAPDVAHWLDDGSFSRWCIADTPEPVPILRDLDELLDPRDSKRLREALSPVGRDSDQIEGRSGNGGKP